MFNQIIKYFLHNRLITVLLFILFIFWGMATSPFDWKLPFFPTDPVPVDAIPNIGDNQQIIFTSWQGRSPQDIQDQISYPLTTALLGIPGVKSIRSTSMFGFSSIYLIFNEDIEFYWSRSRILEKLNSLPKDLLPDGVQPSLGPDATPLGQVFWYTIEGRDSNNNPTGGWDLQNIRTVQDFYVKYGLSAIEGVAEVASIGGFVKEYHIDVNPDALKNYRISLSQIVQAVQQSNQDVGASTIEINQAEYLVRGLGYVKNIQDIEQAVVTVQNNVPIRIKDVAIVTMGPAERRGLLDKGGAEVVGGVVVARYGVNPLQIIQSVKSKIKVISEGLPKKILPNGIESKLTIVPFYDRTQLIKETIGTLEAALSHEVLISIIVVLILLLNLKASILISSLLPVGVLMTFIMMKYVGIDANVVALSGIAIAIGVMVDIGIVFVDNIIRHLDFPKNKNAKGKKLLEVIYNATVEVAPAITTALSTTVVSFIPIFAMESAEGKLFTPLAWTKTFALFATFVLGILILPALSYIIFGIRYDKPKIRKWLSILVVIIGLLLALTMQNYFLLMLCLLGINGIISPYYSLAYQKYTRYFNLGTTLLMVSFLLTKEWMPLGITNHILVNYVFVVVLLGLIISGLLAVVHYYEVILKWCLQHKGKFLLIPLITIGLGLLTWLGFDKMFGVLAYVGEQTGWQVRKTAFWSSAVNVFPGIGSEFMPSLNEGSYLLMPTAMSHAGVSYNRKIIGQLDMLVSQIPEVDVTVGKMGRVESALDPAPIAMYENIINYKPEYAQDEQGHKLRFKVDEEGRFITVSGDSLTNAECIKSNIAIKDLQKDTDGDLYRNWRQHIQSPDDIWEEIVAVTKLPGITSAPKLQPIETRLVMLQTGMRAPMGIKVYGPDLTSIEQFGMNLESILKEVPSVQSEAVFADRIIGAAYLHLEIDRNASARYGLTINQVQNVIQTAIGGKHITTTVEGRERYAIRVRYPRELRNTPQAIKNILITTATGIKIPLSQVINVKYVRGPRMIKSEETFLVGYVLFDKKEGHAEVDVVEDAQAAIQQKIKNKELLVPHGVTFKFSGTYENQIRAAKRLGLVIPISLLVIFLLLYLQFKTIIASSIHFSGVFVALAGGFIMLWLYAQGWFMNFSFLGENIRDVFQIHPINLSVAVWVGFIALFGIATDDGVIMGTYIHQVFKEKNPQTVTAVRQAVITAGKKRVRPAMMTAAVAIIALLPVLTSNGKGSDIMIPMAIPTFGGMIIQVMTIFVVPVLQAYWRESVIKNKK